MQMPKDVTSHILQQQAIQMPEGSSSLGSPSASPTGRAYPQLLEVQLHGVIIHHRKEDIHSRAVLHHTTGNRFHRPVHALQVPRNLVWIQVDQDVIEVQRRAEDHLHGETSSTTQYRTQASRRGKRSFPSPCLHFVPFSSESSKPKTKFL